MSCCGTRYYCTADGPVAVEPDADGWYEVPAGGTSGWYKTEAEAAEICPPPDLAVTCEGGVPSGTVRGVFKVVLYDFTGDFVGGYFPTTEFNVYPYASSPTSVVGFENVLDANGNSWDFGMIVECGQDACDAGNGTGPEMIFLPNVSDVGCPAAVGVNYDAISPCIDYLTSPVSSAVYCMTEGEAFPTGEIPVQLCNFACTGLNGTFKYKVVQV